MVIGDFFNNLINSRSQLGNKSSVNEETCDEGGMWGKLQVGKWLPCQIGCTVAYMNWDTFDALFNSYFLVKRVFLLPTHT